MKWSRRKQALTKIHQKNNLGEQIIQDKKTAKMTAFINTLFQDSALVKLLESENLVERPDLTGDYEYDSIV